MLFTDIEYRLCALWLRMAVSTMETSTMYANVAARYTSPDEIKTLKSGAVACPRCTLCPRCGRRRSMKTIMCLPC
jgi:hypothetical protein